MAWANSKVFRPFIADILGNITNMDLDADSFKAALYDTNCSPDNDVTSANSAYGSGVWSTTTNQVYQASHWAQGGQPMTLASPAINSATPDVVFWDANDTASVDSATTISGAMGVYVYDDTIASPVSKQGVSYNYFGGTPQGVTNGTFTVVWHANGIFRFTL